ncbi:helix-turn-helix transcriptional regulator [Plantactinospora sp. S1510]|uniref:Helix-turn-helix transcriptional regulator n=1 Tax=Plantactinospora alkalitolerans TaxID=2789879 RepID=A0ABS0GWA4_9ACTN|nr:helix-turn-helix transcriptional regulator [Plantactinospora alkalitolerans]MBF9130480.1 helix-turn-helix transcriptional regulator [Plantactinospora alkalitolerans]
MVLLRRVIGDALRARRQGQHRTLREVSSAANVSLGYLSEIERGQKEASSELLAAICDALGARLSELLRDVSDTVEVAEQVPGVLVPAQERPAAERMAQQPVEAEPARSQPVRGEPATQSAQVEAHLPRAGMAEPAVRSLADAGVRQLAAADTVRQITTDGTVSVTVRQESPLKATLRTTRRIQPSANPERDVVCVA